MFKWNKHFAQVLKPNFYNKYGLHSNKILVINKKSELDSFLKDLDYNRI